MHTRVIGTQFSLHKRHWHSVEVTNCWLILDEDIGRQLYISHTQGAGTQSSASTRGTQSCGCQTRPPCAWQSTKYIWQTFTDPMLWSATKWCQTYLQNTSFLKNKVPPKKKKKKKSCAKQQKSFFFFFTNKIPQKKKKKHKLCQAPKKFFFFFLQIKSLKKKKQKKKNTSCAKHQNIFFFFFFYKIKSLKKKKKLFVVTLVVADRGVFWCAVLNGVSIELIINRINIININ